MEIPFCFRAKTCPQCNQPCQPESAIKLFLNINPDPLVVKKSIQIPITAKRKYQEKTVEDIKKEMKEIKQRSQQREYELSQELLAEQQIRMYVKGNFYFIF